MWIGFVHFIHHQPGSLSPDVIHTQLHRSGDQDQIWQYLKGLWEASKVRRGRICKGRHDDDDDDDLPVINMLPTCVYVDDALLGG